jgi:uncharacterized protein (DUF433 family)
MDILDIVNNFIKSKTEINPETIINKLNNGESLESIVDEYYVSKNSLLETLKESGYIYNQSTLKWVKPTPATIPIKTLYEIVSEMFINNYDISLMSNKYTIPKEVLIKELEYNKFRKRWTYIGESSTQKITHKLKSYLYQLNTLKEDIKVLADYEGLSVSDIQEKLSNAFYREIWMLEEVIDPPVVISTVNDGRIIYDSNTGEPIVLSVKGRKLFTMKQVSTILHINAKYFFFSNKDFTKDIHYVKGEEFFGKDKEIFKAVPHTDYLQNEILFTVSGLELFAVKTNTTISYKNKIQELEAINIPKQHRDNPIVDEKRDPKIFPENKKEEKITIADLSNEMDEVGKAPITEAKMAEIEEKNVTGNISPEKYDLNVESIIEKLNNNISIAVIARDLKVQIYDLNITLRDAGYRFDSFFYLWTKETETKLIENAVNQLKKGITLYDISNKYRKDKRLRLLFADELRRKIEALGYVRDQSSKKWILNQQRVESIYKKVDGFAFKQDQPSHSIVNKTEETSNSKTKFINEISDKLNEGKSLKQIEEDMGIPATTLRMTLKNEGYKYDSFFKTWINVDRKVVLDKIAEEVSSNRNTIEGMAKTYHVEPSELEEQLKQIGNCSLHIGSQNEINKMNELDAPHGITNKISNEPEKIDKINYKLKLNEEEYQLLKEILIERKNSKEESSGKKGIKVYLRSEILEKMDELAEQNNMSKSRLIEKAFDHYLTHLK